MDPKVINYHAQPYGECQLGFGIISVEGKCNFLVKVLKSKAGNIYCAFNSMRVADEWIPSFSFADKEYERNFLAKCLDQIKPMLEPQEEKEPEPVALKPQSQYVPDPDLPF